MKQSHKTWFVKQKYTAYGRKAEAQQTEGSKTLVLAGEMQQEFEGVIPGYTSLIEWW